MTYRDGGTHEGAYVKLPPIYNLFLSTYILYCTMCIVVVFSKLGTVGEGEELVVVEHGVEVLDPDGVHGPIGDDPRVVGVGLLVVLGPHGREHTRGPLAAHQVHLLCHTGEGGGVSS